MLAQRFSALEVDHKVTQESLQEAKRTVMKLEGILVSEQSQKQLLTTKLANENQNNKMILKELSRANKTITQLRGLLEK